MNWKIQDILEKREFPAEDSEGNHLAPIPNTWHLKTEGFQTESF